MRNRDYKQFAEGEYYHIFNRGAGKQDIFKDEKDYHQFIRRIKLAFGYKEPGDLPKKVKRIDGESIIYRSLRLTPFPRGTFSIISYCLMPNHFHLLIRQNGKIPINQLLSKVCTSYAMYFNRKYDRVGTLFQDAFKSIHVDDNSYLLWLSAYIHQNPAAAGLVWDITRWQWSSYSEYVDTAFKGEFCDKVIILDQFKTRGSYKKFVEDSFDEIKRKKQISQYLLD